MWFRRCRDVSSGLIQVLLWRLGGVIQVLQWRLSGVIQVLQWRLSGVIQALPWRLKWPDSGTMWRKMQCKRVVSVKLESGASDLAVQRLSWGLSGTCHLGLCWGWFNSSRVVRGQSGDVEEMVVKRHPGGRQAREAGAGGRDRQLLHLVACWSHGAARTRQSAHNTWLCRWRVLQATKFTSQRTCQLPSRCLLCGFAGLVGSRLALRIVGDGLWCGMLLLNKVYSVLLWISSLPQHQVREVLLTLLHLHHEARLTVPKGLKTYQHNMTHTDTRCRNL